MSEGIDTEGRARTLDSRIRNQQVTGSSPVAGSICNQSPSPAPVLKPRRLRPGDTVAAVSLSWGGAATFPHRYDAGKKQFTNEFGVHVIDARHALPRHTPLADSRVARRRALVS